MGFGVLALESSTMTLKYSGFLHQKHKTNNTQAPRLYNKSWLILLFLGLNERLKVKADKSGAKRALTLL